MKTRIKVSRILVTIGVVLIAIVVYEAKIRPQSRPLYERALGMYRSGQYAESLIELERAYQIEPNNTAILVLRGWNHLKLREYSDARVNFARAARLDATLTDAQLGLAYVWLETGSGEATLEGVRALLDQSPNNADFQLAAGAAFRRAGKNSEAQEIFQRLLRNRNYEEVALKNLQDMYGLEGTSAAIPSGIKAVTRPANLNVAFRAEGGYLQVPKNGGWENLYVKGVNLQPAYPGNDNPNRVDTYLKWLHEMAQLGANTVRVYTILPPAFYRALKRHNETAGEPALYLLQGLPLIAEDVENLFDRDVETQARDEVARMIDAVHGQGNLPAGFRRSGGLYVEDVSPYVLGFVLGRQLDPHLVLRSDEINSAKINYQGSYVSAPKGSPTEVWYARLLDFAVGYEVEKYNQQRPVSLVNWPPLDPLSHPTEAGLQEQLSFRRRLGERVGPLPKVYDDNDVVAIDEMHLSPEPQFRAKLFASYHAYPSYPAFLLHEPALLAARDAEGPNAYFGYLRALKAHYSGMPLLVGEYGVSSSLGVSKVQPQGLNEGGFNERQQGELIARMTRDIAEAGCAGGVVFEWQDQWAANNWLTAPLETPVARRELWLNELNPRQSYGVWTYDSSRSNLFSANGGPWQTVRPLYQKPSRGPARLLNDGLDGTRTLRSLSVASDEAYVYVRLGVAELRRTRDGLPDLAGANYAVVLSTLPGKFGGRTLPALAPAVRYPEGFNFLLAVGGSAQPSARLLVAGNYSAFAQTPIEGLRDRFYIGLRNPWNPSLEDWTPFEDMVVEPNPMTFSRDGMLFEAQRHNRSVLRYGSPDPAAPNSDSLATWVADFGANSLVFRIPWGLLQFTDPSSRQVYAGTEAGGAVRTATTEGVALAAISLKPADGGTNWSRFPALPLAFTDSLPAVSSEGTFERVERYRWDGWGAVKLEGRLKTGAAAVQKALREVKAR